MLDYVHKQQQSDHGKKVLRRTNTLVKIIDKGFGLVGEEKASAPKPVSVHKSEIHEKAINGLIDEIFSTMMLKGLIDSLYSTTNGPVEKLQLIRKYSNY